MMKWDLDNEMKQLNNKRGLQAKDDVTIPDSVNWVEQGAVNPIQNQGQCGSCWAFSTVGAMEGRNQIKNNELVKLSEQQLVDCADSFGNKGCKGGLIDGAYRYTESNALETET